MRLSTPLILVVATQFLLLCIGLEFLSFNIRWFDVLIATTTAITVELGLSLLFHRKISVPISAIAAALGICLFLRATHWWLFALAAGLAVASKYILRNKNGAHIFNPSNLGILAVVFLFTQNTTIEFTQWGNNVYVYVLFAFLILTVAIRARVFVTTLAFLTSYTIGLFILLPYAPDIFSAHHYGILGPSLLLFAAFMITDPRTAPKGLHAGVLHGIAVAALYFFLEFLGIRYSLFVASFVATVLNVLSVYLYTHRPMLSRYKVTNIYTMILGICVFMYASISTIYTSTHTVRINDISLMFLIGGIEHGSFLQCGTHTVLKATTLPGIRTTNDYTSGIAWGDYDNDGDDDLFVSSLNKPGRLYQNNDGVFIDVTEVSALPSTVSPASAFFADYDNDRDLDLFLVAPFETRQNMPRSLRERFQNFISPSPTQGIAVYENNNGVFVDITHKTGLDAFRIDRKDAATLTFGDYDSDGDLDFVAAVRGRSMSLNNELQRSALHKSLFDPFFDTEFVLTCNPNQVHDVLLRYAQKDLLSHANIQTYLKQNGCISQQNTLPIFMHETTQEIQELNDRPFEVTFRIPGSARLFENVDGRFSEHTYFHEDTLIDLPTQPTRMQTATQPFQTVSGRFYQPVSFDYDNDGDIDVFLAVDTGRNILMENQGNFVFVDVTADRNLDLHGSGMGVDVTDYNRDGFLDLLVTNVKHDYLLTNTGTQFTVHPSSLGALNVGWGLSFLDYNLDGWDDIFIANGDIQATSDIPFGSVGKSLFRTNLLFKNTASGDFQSTSWIDMCPQQQSSYALATTDYDNDGDDDVLVGNVQSGENRPSTNTLYKNYAEQNYIQVRLHGTRSNTFGVGAQVQVFDAYDRPQMKQITLGSSLNSQNSLTLTFGLGEQTETVRIKVLWPSGLESVIYDVEPNQTITIREE